MRIKKYILMKKLTSMVKFVLEQFNKWKEDNKPDCQSSARYILGTSNYANFLKQPLELWMFVPCDEEGNVMKEPYMVFADDNEECEDYIKLFCEAKERVLFEGFSTSYQEETNDTFGFYTLFKNGRIFIKFQKTDQLFVNPDNIVENLTKHNISLTPTALKQLCLNH